MTRALLEQALKALNSTNLDLHASAVEAIRAELGKPQDCRWTFQDDDSGTYASGCGELWSFLDGGPLENRVGYCHGCGKPVALKDKP